MLAVTELAGIILGGTFELADLRVIPMTAVSAGLLPGRRFGRFLRERPVPRNAKRVPAHEKASR